MSFATLLWVECWVIGYCGQLDIACCIYETSAMLAETKQLVKTKVCHLFVTHTPKLTTTFMIFKSANGWKGSTVCDGPAYRTRFHVMNRVRHWTSSHTALEKKSALFFVISSTLPLWRLGLLCATDHFSRAWKSDLYQWKGYGCVKKVKSDHVILSLYT
jgi:hypothetical protein